MSNDKDLEGIEISLINGDICFDWSGKEFEMCTVIKDTTDPGSTMLVVTPADWKNIQRVQSLQWEEELLQFHGYTLKTYHEDNGDIYRCATGVDLGSGCANYVKICNILRV